MKPLLSRPFHQDRRGQSALEVAIEIRFDLCACLLPRDLKISSHWMCFLLQNIGNDDNNIVSALIEETEVEVGVFRQFDQVSHIQGDHYF